MKIFLVVSIGVLLFSNYCFSQYALEIEVTAISNNTGNIMLQLFDEKEEILIQDMSEIKDKKCSFSIKNLKAGKYAVRYFHDENINGNLDTNLVGKPTEGYGFSNNVTGTFDPPPFKKWLFEIKGDIKIVLKPTY
jgi:uncharacterized protein (DUF2141 family)